MSSLVETHHQVQGTTVLYLLPDEDLSKGAADMELCQRLEGALIHWTRQIKEVLSLAGGAGATGGPSKTPNRTPSSSSGVHGAQHGAEPSTPAGVLWGNAPLLDRRGQLGRCVRTQSFVRVKSLSV